MKDAFTIGISGHRPGRLGLYTQEGYDQLDNFAQEVIDQEIEDYEQGIAVHVGGALGWDTSIALACVERDVPIYLYLVHDQTKYWSGDLVRVSESIKKYAEAVYIYKKSPGEYKLRNTEIIRRVRKDNERSGGKMLCLWDGSVGGGTYHTIKMANAGKVPWVNCFKSWERFVGTSRQH